MPAPSDVTGTRMVNGMAESAGVISRDGGSDD